MSPNTEKFDVIPGNYGDTPVMLIRPKKIDFSWEEEDLRFRSLVQTQSGKVISSGFPKFFNWGENPAHDKKVQKVIAAGKVGSTTEKLDGTLIIRFVFQGQVRFRTRGSLGLGDFEVDVNKMVTQHPWLLDPNICPNSDLLFELVGHSVESDLVVTYPSLRLVYLGRMLNHELYSPYVPYSLEAGQLDLPKAYQATVLAPDFVAMIRGWKEQEGVVVSFPGGLLVKVKTDWYLTMARLMSRVTGKYLARYVLLNDFHTTDEVARQLRVEGLEESIVLSLTPAIQEVLKARQAQSMMLANVLFGFTSALDLPAKDFALKVQETPVPQWIWSWLYAAKREDTTLMRNIENAQLLGEAVNFTAQLQKQASKSLTRHEQA